MNAVRRTAGLVAALAFTGALAVAAPSPAVAAPAGSPSSALGPAQWTRLKTNWLGSTTFCARNSGSEAGTVLVIAYGADPETVTTPAGAQQCISRWWGGASLVIVNAGRTNVDVRLA